jgi:hypothetical protein
MPNPINLDAALALSRFGLGAREDTRRTISTAKPIVNMA